jgi:hypothetical protein
MVNAAPPYRPLEDVSGTQPVRAAATEPPPPPQPSRVSRGWVVAVAIGILIALRVVVVAIAIVSPDAAGPRDAFLVDAGRYHEIAEHAGRPYQAFDVEYPPVTLAFIEAVNGPTRSDTARNVAIASLLLDVAVAGALAWGWGRRVAVVYLALGLPFLLLPFVYFRVDLLSVALAVWGLALVRRNRPVAGGVLFALAVFAKLWPLALLPWFVVHRKWRALATTVATGAIGAALWFAWSGTDGVAQVVTFRHARGWQIESLLGGFAHLVTDAPTRIESGAVRVGDSPAWASAVLGVVIVALVSWIWVRAAHARDRSVQLADGLVPLTAICVVLLCSPLLSPQYLIWLMPFAAIAWTPGRPMPTVLVVVATMLTMWLATGYVDLTNGQLGAELLLVARNLTLVTIVVLGFAATRTGLASRRPGTHALPAAFPTTRGAEPVVPV